MTNVSRMFLRQDLPCGALFARTARASVDNRQVFRYLKPVGANPGHRIQSMFLSAVELVGARLDDGGRLVQLTSLPDGFQPDTASSAGAAPATNSPAIPWVRSAKACTPATSTRSVSIPRSLTSSTGVE